VIIAAGSHWARRIASTASLPANVEYRSDPLSFVQLRDLYRRASVVVVPLLDVPNQSGVTTILEALSMGVPVIVTASRGQRECVRGPLATGEGFNDAATADRGPELFTGQVPPPEPNGIYVPPHDPGALRVALERLFVDPELRTRLGVASRETAVTHFTIERYVARLAALLEPGDETRPSQLVVTA
jgi:glycosyltransferase involved in cell wall biosynthesis